MMDLQLYEGDLKISNGDLAICSDDHQAMAQAVKIRLKTFKEEWFLDTDIGLPYFSHILGQKPKIPYLRHLIASQIENIAGVKKIEDFNIQLNSNRTLLINFNIILLSGNNISFNEKLGVEL